MSVFSFGLVSNCYSLIAADVRNCAMKLLYSKMTWSFCGLPDGLPLMPVAKFVRKGMRLIVGFPFTSSIANLKGTEYAPTLSNLCVGVLNMNAKDFITAGGFWSFLKAGDCLWIPPSTVICEFGVLDPTSSDGKHQIHQALSWAAPLQQHLSADFLKCLEGELQFVLQNCCCHPSAHSLEKDYEAHMKTRFCGSRVRVAC